MCCRDAQGVFYLKQPAKAKWICPNAGFVANLLICRLRQDKLELASAIQPEFSQDQASEALC